MTILIQLCRELLHEEMHLVSYWLDPVALGLSQSYTSLDASSDCHKMSWAEAEESQESRDVFIGSLCDSVVMPPE